MLLKYAVEPVSVTNNLLSKNIKSLSSIKAFRLGLLDKSQRKTIYYNRELLMYSSLFSERFTWDRNPHKETISLTTLDSFSAKQKIDHIDLLKIDAEGAEEKILKRAIKTLSRARYLFIEVALDQVGDSTFSSLIGTLKGRGYDFQLIRIVSTLKDKNGRLLLVNLLLKNLAFKP